MRLASAMAYRIRRPITALTALALALALVRCGSSSPTSHGGGGGSGTICVAGQRVACGCADGSESAKACKADGSGYFACICEIGVAGASGEGGAAGEAALTSGATS
jgi:hypothetical protein